MADSRKDCTLAEEVDRAWRDEKTGASHREQQEGSWTWRYLGSLELGTTSYASWSRGKFLSLNFQFLLGSLDAFQVSACVQQRTPHRTPVASCLWLELSPQLSKSKEEFYVLQKGESNRDKADPDWMLLLAGVTAFPVLAVDKIIEVPVSPAPEQLRSIAPVRELAPITLDESYDHFEAIPVPGGVPQLNMPPTESVVAVEANDGSEAIMQPQSISSITPLCTTLDIDNVYLLSGTSTGEAYCYHFEITQRAKTQVFLIGQNENTDFSLALLRHEEDDTLTVLGISDQSGNADEILLALTEPGHYYWLMEANASDGSAFQFGSLANTAADAYELNDTVSLSTPIPDGRPPMVGNMDSAQDVDYFHYMAQNGQNLYVIVEDQYGQNEWSLEYFAGSYWAPLSVNQGYTLSSLPTPFTLHVRISPTSAASVNPSHSYRLTVGSAVTSSDMVNVQTYENLERIPYGYTDPYLTTQAHNELYWSIRVLDSTGAPVAGVPVNFHYETVDIPEQTHSAVSSAAGIATGYVALPDCVGNWTVIHSSFGDTWRTEFDFGRWHIKVPGTNSNEVGVGGTHYPHVTLGHICKQTLQ